MTTGTVWNMDDTEEERLSRIIGANVRAEMVRASRRQEDLAAHLRMAQSSLSGRLNGTIPFRITELIELSKYLGVPIARFLVDVE